MKSTNRIRNQAIAVAPQFSKPQSFGSWLDMTRPHYLDFLRNLTPQVVLASLALVIAMKLDFNKFDISNWMQTAGFLIYLLAFGWSFWANATLFLERLFPEFSEWRKAEEGKLLNSGIRGRRFILEFFRQVVKHRPLEATLAIAMIFFLQFVLAGVLISSIAAAVNFLRAMH